MRHDERTDGGVNRRRFLRTAGAATLAPAALSSAASGQENRYLRRMVIPRIERFSDDYVGRFVLLSDPLEKEPEASAIDDCEFASWSPDETDVYEGLIIDRHQTQEAVQTDIYMRTGTEFEPGTLFIITAQSPCPNDYVGLEATQVPDERLPPINNSSRQTVPETTADGDAGGLASPGQSGFGPLAALGGIIGATWYRVHRGRER